MGGIVDSLFGGGGETTTTVTNTPNPMSDEEKELIRLQADLSKRQLANIDRLQPFQKELLNLSLADLRRQGSLNKAFDTAVTPEDQAAAFKEEFERSKKLGPIQEELLAMQLAEAKRGGAATPEQLQLIKEATDAGISAGSADIDASTQRGLGLIADELANSRGLRMSDSPIRSEAALLAREGEIQKGSLVKNLRANEATARLNYPMAASQLRSGIALSQQELTNASRAFQADLRQRAQANRLAMTGTSGQFGIGLSSIGNSSGALSALASARGSTRTTTAPEAGLDLGGLGGLMQGASAAWPILKSFSDRRLKTDIVKVDEDERGIGIYEYTKFGRRKRGVMADEVARVSPHAVAVHPSGYLTVDYGKI